MLLARSRALDRLRSERVDTAYRWENFAEGFDIVDSGHSPKKLAQAKQTQANGVSNFECQNDSLFRWIECEFGLRAWFAWVPITSRCLYAASAFY